MSESSPMPGADAQIGKAFVLGSQTEQSFAMAVALLDLQDAALPVRRLRDWGLTHAQLKAGQAVVDVGSGTGTMIAEVAALVGPTSRAVGIEPNPKLRDLAGQRLAGVTGVELVDGVADSLPLEDSSVDLIWCERVLQHLEDPQAALTEFYRVLKPGGRAIVLDADHASRVTADIDADVAARALAGFLHSTPNPSAARHVPRQAITAGFALHPDVGSAALLTPPPGPGEVGLIRAAVQQAVTTGFITQDEADEALRSYRAAVEAGWAFSAVTIFGFVLLKG